MGEKIKAHASVLILDALGFVFCLMGVYSIHQKTDLPFKISLNNSQLIISPLYSSINSNISGAILISIDDFHFRSREEIEVYLDGKNIEDHVSIVYLQNRVTSQVESSLVPFYTNSYLGIITVTGCLFFLVAIFILIKAQDKKPAKLYHAINITTAAIIMTTWGNYNIGPYSSGLFSRGIFHFAYAFAPALFLYFVFVFPRDEEAKHKQLIISLFTISSILFLFLNYLFIRILIGHNLQSIRNYVSGFNAYRLFIIIAVLYGIFLFIQNYIKSGSHVERKKIKWILFGFLVGPGSFILMWVIPQTITGYGIVPEEFIIILMLAIPFTFGISIYRYHLLDIDFLINRSWVYAIVLTVCFCFYALLVGIAVTLAGRLTVSISFFVSAAASVIIGFIFQPLKNYVQKFIDKKFFRMKYNFKTAHLLLTEEINNSFTIEKLQEKLSEGINEILRPEELLIYLPGTNISGVKPDYGSQNLIESIIEKLNSTNTILAAKDYIEGEMNFVPIIESEFYLKLLIPVMIPGEKGFIALGKRKSRLKYNTEDIDFLNDVAGLASLAAERIILQKELLLKQAEADKLKELNEIKSFFVSTVSHELKTPLTSIKMFAQILQGMQLSEGQGKNYLKIIEEEGNRLTRLIDNVLDYAKIEKGIKEYNFEKTDFNETIRETMEVLHYQISINNFEVQTSYDENEIFILADKDALKEAIINLISNAIKYSGSSKMISISTYRQNEFICVSVQDFGIGIPSDKIKNIFLPFTRLRDFDTKIYGTGIGLTIVKHIMDAHRGKIDILSEPGKGSCFSLKFPVLD